MEEQKTIEVSLVIPVYNEEANLNELIRRCLVTCDSLNCPYEIILVDDGSSDSSAEMIRKVASEHGGRVVGVFLTTNFGQHAAVTAGLQTSLGRYVITLDADLQNPPEEVPRLVEKLCEGYDVVGTIREKRKDTFFRRFASKIVNRMVRSLCNGKTMTDYGCMLRGYSRTVVNAILQCPEHGKFIPMLAMSYARRVTEINVRHADRTAGESKYNFWKLIALQYDLLTGTSIFPLRMLTYIGTIVAVLGILFGIFIFIMTRIHGDEWSQHGVFTLFSLVFIFMGGQFVAMGILGEYIGKIHMNSRGRPQFFIESVVGRKNS